MILKKDNFVLGLILGLLAPFGGFLVYKFTKFQQFSMADMFHFLRNNTNLITGFISVSLLANAVLFTLYINSRRDKTGKGIFVMTVVYVAIAMGFKYL